MDIEIINKYHILIILLEECNFDCPHCIREDEPMVPGYKLTFEQLHMFLMDCRSLESVLSVGHSGGETTLWTDGDLDLIDVLVAESMVGLQPGFTTNGSLFVDTAACNDFFNNYFSKTTKSLRVNISIDTFHNNFDTKKQRCQSLDNVLNYRDNIATQYRNLLNIIPLATISKDPSSFLPDEMLQHYQERGAPFRILPVRPEGKAKSFTNLYPDRRQSPKKKPGSAYLILIGDSYYVHKTEWHIIGRLGHLPQTIINAFSK